MNKMTLWRLYRANFVRTNLGSALGPRSAARRATKAACAEATMALVGVHPRFTQVPPTSLRSTTVTERPLPASLVASAGLRIWSGATKSTAADVTAR